MCPNQGKQEWDDLDQNHPIDAAKAAGVGEIVYTSLLHADRSPLDCKRFASPVVSA